jgi:NTE family protein
MKKVKLVLSGSGTRYPVFAGAIKRILLEGYEIEEVCGTSGGAIVAAALGTKYGNNSLNTIIDLTDMMLKSIPSRLLDPRWFPYGTKGLFKGNKFLKEFEKRFVSSFEETRIPVNIVTYNLDKGMHKVWNAKDAGANLPLCVRASMSLPFIFDPVIIDGDSHIDGGIAANFPLDIFGSGENVIGLRFQNTNPPSKKTIKTKIDLIGATIDGMMNSTMNEHIEDAVYARICPLQTKHAGLNLLMTKEDMFEQMREGFRSADNWIKKDLDKA